MPALACTVPIVEITKISRAYAKKALQFPHMFMTPMDVITCDTAEYLKYLSVELKVIKRAFFLQLWQLLMK